MKMSIAQKGNEPDVENAVFDANDVLIIIEERPLFICDCDGDEEYDEDKCDACKPYHSHLLDIKKVVISLVNKKTGEGKYEYLDIRPSIKYEDGDPEVTNILEVFTNPDKVNSFQFSENKVKKHLYASIDSYKKLAEELRSRLNIITDIAIKGSPQGYALENLKHSLAQKSEQNKELSEALNQKNQYEFLNSVATVDDLAKVIAERNEWKRKYMALLNKS